MIKIVPGQVYEIADQPHGFYHAIIATGGDVIFVDAFSRTPAASIGDIDISAELMRLAVNHPTIRRAKWRLIGLTPVEGRLAEYGRYVHGQPVSGMATVFDNKDSSEKFVPEAEAEQLELLEVWDAVNHIPKLLRQHFFGYATTLSRNIRSPLFRKEAP